MNALLVGKVQLGETINCLLPRLHLNFPAGHHASPRAAEEQMLRGPIEQKIEITKLRNLPKSDRIRSNQGKKFS